MIFYSIYIGVFESKNKEVLGIDLKIYDGKGSVVSSLSNEYNNNPSYRELEKIIFSWLEEFEGILTPDNCFVSCNNNSFGNFFTGIITRDNRYKGIVDKNRIEYSTVSPIKEFDGYKVKVYFDATYDQNTLKCVIATLIIENTEIIARAVSYGKSRSIFGAEHYALDFAIRYYKKIKDEEESKENDVIFIGDNQQVISALFSKNIYRRNCRIKNTFTELNKLKAELAWVNSNENLADKLTRS